MILYQSTYEFAIWCVASALFIAVLWRTYEILVGADW